MTLGALGYFVDPNQPVTLMTLLIPSSNYPSKLFDEVKSSIPLDLFLNQIEQYARQEFEKRNYLKIFVKFLPLTVENGEVLHKKVENYLQDESKDYFVVRGSHGAGKTIYCRYLEWYLWENYERYQTIPLYLSLQTVKTVDELNEIIEQLFEKNGCSPFLDEAKKNYRVLLIVDHIGALPPKSQFSEDCDLVHWKKLKVIVMDGSPQKKTNLDRIILPDAQGISVLDRTLTVAIQPLDDKS